jgi:hypothetical protein
VDSVEAAELRSFLKLWLNRTLKSARIAKMVSTVKLSYKEAGLGIVNVGKPFIVASKFEVLTDLFFSSAISKIKSS